MRTFALLLLAILTPEYGIFIHTLRNYLKRFCAGFEDAIWRNKMRKNGFNNSFFRGPKMEPIGGVNPFEIVSKGEINETEKVGGLMQPSR